MRTETVEILSDATNAAVMRHPGRKFPGILIQGDTLFIKCQMADEACEAARGRVDDDDFVNLTDLRDWLRGLLDHYNQVLGAHDMKFPFFEGLEP
jgi:Family of unknown function (DUF6959)